MKRFALLLFLLLTTPMSHASNDMDGNKLLKYCKKGIKAAENNDIDSSFGTGYCIGLVRGSINAGSGINAVAKLYEYDKQEFYCVPDEVTNLQAVRIIIKYLENNPEYLHYKDTALIGNALHENFPCK